MKILMINSVCGIRSTGRICTDQAEILESEGHECKIAYGREAVPKKFQRYAIRIGNDFDNKIAGALTRLTDNHGFSNKRATKKFLKWANEYDPDMLWLHNIHGYYINVETLFDWIKSRPQMKVRWTLHDCWAFTGHCSHFTAVGCDKWKTCCGNCEQKRQYPASLVLDNSHMNFERKKAAFTGVKDMTLITPSNWLKELVEQSFLAEYPVEVVNNTIDTSVFKPTTSDFRKRYNLEDKRVILGVSSVWNERKGFDDFLSLSKLIGEDYRIVLVGLNKKQMKGLPGNIIGIKRTNSTRELAEIYTAADVFVNPSKEETFGLTTVEALACGVYVIVYKETACEEIVASVPGKSVVVDVGDVNGIYKSTVYLMQKLKNNR